MKRLILDDAFQALFPDAALAVLCVHLGPEARRPAEAQAREIRALLAQANLEARKHLTSDVISENAIPASWREAYRRFPTKKGARCSIENLLKRVLHDKPLTSIAPTVDLTNAISLRYGVPIGAEDLDAFVGDLHLGAMKGTEDFLPLGEDAQDPPLPGEIGYYDEAGAVCRCWNWRDGRRTAVTDGTVNEFIVMECIEPHRMEDLRAAQTELTDLLKRYAGAEVLASGLVTAQAPEMVIAG